MAANSTQLIPEPSSTGTAASVTPTMLQNEVRKSIIIKPQTGSTPGFSGNPDTPLQGTEFSTDVDSAASPNIIASNDPPGNIPELSGHLADSTLQGSGKMWNTGPETSGHSTNKAEAPSRENLLQYDSVTGDVTMLGFSLKSMFVVVGEDNLIYCLNAIDHANLLVAGKRTSFLIMDLETKKMYPNGEFKPIDPEQSDVHHTIPMYEIEKVTDNPTAVKKGELSGTEAAISMDPSPEDSIVRPLPVTPDKPTVDIVGDSDEEYQPPASRKRKRIDVQLTKKPEQQTSPQPPVWTKVLQNLERLPLKQAVTLLKYEPVTLEETCAAMDRNCIRYVVASGSYGKTSAPSFWDDFFTSIPLRARKSNTTVYSNRWRRTITQNLPMLEHNLDIIGLPACYLDLLAWFKAQEQRYHGRQHVVVDADVMLLARKLSEANQLMPLIPHSDDSS